jgi:hypothetical protein
MYYRPDRCPAPSEAARHPSGRPARRAHPGNSHTRPLGAVGPGIDPEADRIDPIDLGISGGLPGATGAMPGLRLGRTRCRDRGTRRGGTAQAGIELSRSAARDSTTHPPFGSCRGAERSDAPPWNPQGPSGEMADEQAAAAAPPPRHNPRKGWWLVSVLSLTDVKYLSRTFPRPLGTPGTVGTLFRFEALIRARQPFIRKIGSNPSRCSKGWRDRVQKLVGLGGRSRGGWGWAGRRPAPRPLTRQERCSQDGRDGLSGRGVVIGRLL